MKSKDWKKLILDWHRSGLSQAEFCRQYNLNKNSFGSWLRRFREQESQQLGFVEVGVEREASVLEIRLASGAMIRVPSGFEPETLKQILKVLH